MAEKAKTEKGLLKIAHEEARTQGWYAEIEHLADVLIDQVTPLISGEDGLRALQVAMAAYESSITNKQVTVNYE